MYNIYSYIYKNSDQAVRLNGNCCYTLRPLIGPTFMVFECFKTKIQVIF